MDAINRQFAKLHALQRLGLAGFFFFLAKGILWIAVPGILTFYGL